MNVPQIRIAGSADATALAAFAEQTFRDAFEAENDPADFEDYLAKAFTPAQIERELADSDACFLLATDGDGLVGYAKLRQASAPNDVGGRRPIELERIYVDIDRHRRGVGSALLESAFATARERGADGIWLGVWQHNHHAISFYERAQFRRVGVKEFLLGRDRQQDLVMFREL